VTSGIEREKESPRVMRGLNISGSVCRHSVAIKRIIDMMEDGREASKAMRPDQALFLFLKFISSVIPTVEYDFTMDFDT